MRWFIAGAFAVPLFHQVMLVILYAVGWVERAPFALTPTKPFGVPQVVSLSFWAGLWGVVLGLVLQRVVPGRLWLVALVVGAIAPTVVAIFVAAPLKGQPIGGDAKMLVTGVLVNAAWGVGTAALARIGAGDVHVLSGATGSQPVALGAGLRARPPEGTSTGY